MTNLRNSVRLVGFLGNDPEVKVLANNNKLAKVSIAIHDSYNNERGEKVEDTQWHNLVMWAKNAVFAETHLHKGSEISIEGSLKSRVYTDKMGVKKYYTDIVVNEITLVERNKEQEEKPLAE
jgi:single-strand DNA-binding protein